MGPRPNNFGQSKSKEVNVLDLQPVDMIVIYWCTINSKNYLVMVEYSLGYLWAKQSLHKTTQTCLKLPKINNRVNFQAGNGN